MQLSELADVLGASIASAPDGPIEIAAVTHNAQWATPGCVFVAIKGASVDGHDFVPAAASLGAVAVIGERDPADAPRDLPYLQVESARVALGQAAAALAGKPADKLTTIGVTGTDGKTSTSWMVRHVLRSAGLRTGLLSTVGYSLPDGVLRSFPEHFTTPESPQVQDLLATMVRGGTDAAVIEASSHALALERLHGISWDVAVWTQLTREHLDFHGDMESYFEAKRSLIESARFAVLNADDPWTERLHGLAETETSYGLADGAQWRATNIRESVEALRFELTCPQGVFDVSLPMVGRFNVHNALAALAAAHHVGVSVETGINALGDFPGIPGRMQRVAPGDGEADDVHIVIDFAHTEVALEGALQALRTLAEGELWVVVGAAGGNRDPGKRRPMGEVATRIADHTVFTEDDFRDTPLEEIFAEMEAGARGELGATGEASAPGTAIPRGSYRSISDRSEAIQYAVTHAKPGAIILLAGKGAEDFMARFDRLDPWDETNEAHAALELRQRRRQ